jgi:hypothetical protein
MEPILRSQKVTHYCHVAWHMLTQLPVNAQNLESHEIRPKKTASGCVVCRNSRSACFINILLITIPPLIVYLFFNRQIVADGWRYKGIGSYGPVSALGQTGHHVVQAERLL